MVTTELEKKEFEKVDQIVERYADEDGALIQVLLDAQHEYSWLSKDVLMRISERMEIPVSYMYRVASFYEAMSLTPSAGMWSMSAWVQHVTFGEGQRF